MDERRSNSMHNHSSTRSHRFICRINYISMHQKLRKRTSNFLKTWFFHLIIHLLQHNIALHFLRFLIGVRFHFALSRSSACLARAPIVWISHIVRRSRSLDVEFWLCSVFCVEGQRNGVLCCVCCSCFAHFSISALERPVY